MNVLIVGGGLSGLCLGHTFLNEKIDFEIIDAGENHSSSVAAGMINPMVFRKMVKTWRGDDLIPFLNAFYPSIEKRTGEKFFFPRKIRRVFSTPDEKKYWDKRLENEEYKDYIHAYADSEPSPDYIINKYGNAWVKSPGYVDAKIFMKANHSFFLAKNKLSYETFDFDQLDTSQLTYKNKAYTHIIFAEGYRGKENPYFNYLPLQQTKGEVLSVKSNTLKKDEILNRKCFVLPLHDGTFKLGATFAWDTTDLSTTNEARTQLLEQYKQLSTAEIEITGQEAGIRPTVTDRRPLIGEHPEKKGLYIFNGMGTKGYMIAPYFSKVFLDYLTNSKDLDQEVNIERFYQKHFNK